MKKAMITVGLCFLTVFSAALADEDPLTQFIFSGVGRDAGSQDSAQGETGAGALKSDDLLMAALGLIGVRYKFGGTSPVSGFDCSGFVRYVFQQSLGIALPRSAAEISQIGQRVNQDDLRPGDLVFFNTMKRAFSHVGIYMGDGKFIHSPSSGKSVQVVNIHEAYWAKRYNGARRVAAANPS